MVLGITGGSDARQARRSCVGAGEAVKTAGSTRPTSRGRRGEAARGRHLWMILTRSRDASRGCFAQSGTTKSVKTAHGIVKQTL